MSGELVSRAAILGALRDDAVLMALVNQVSEGEPVKASAPWLLVADAAASGWGARGVEGLTLRQPLLLVLRGDDLGRVTDILARIDIVLTGIDGELGDWRITSLRFERSRIVRSRTEWRATVDYVLRMARQI